MKYLKMLGPAAVAAMALVAFGAGTASATKLYKGATAVGAGTEIQASLAIGGSARLTTTEGTTLNTCTGSTIKGSTSNAGGSAETVKGSVTAANLTWSGCNNTVDTIEGGELEIHHISGTTNGTLTAKGFKVNVLIPFFGTTCTYTAGAGTHMGTLTGVSVGNAVMDVNAIVTTSSPGCPPSARWQATYTVTNGFNSVEPA